MKRLVLPAAIVFGVALFWCFGAIRVPPGMDTMPAIPPGSLCIVDKRVSAAQPGMAVFVDVPDGGTLLSRITAVQTDGRLLVRNDNGDSALPDGDDFGPLSPTALRGAVLVVFPGEGAAGEVIRGR